MKPLNLSRWFSCEGLSACFEDAEVIVFRQMMCLDHLPTWPTWPAGQHEREASFAASHLKASQYQFVSTPVKLQQRYMQRTRWLSMLLLFIFLTTPDVLSAATVWNGPKTVFVKADGSDPAQAASQDRLTSNVWLTRGGSQGLYNVAREAFFSHFVSPADTEWASGSTDNYKSLKYSDWETWAKSVGNPPATPGVNAVLHLKTDDIYLDIKFLSWSKKPTNGGGFSYERSTDASSVPTSFLLSINAVGAGSVVSNPAGINCGSTCSASFNEGTSVTLTATPALGFIFAGWSGDCAGTDSCTVSTNTTRNVTAIFTANAPSLFTLSVSIAGTGYGNVSSSPTGISCYNPQPNVNYLVAADCSEGYASDTSVTLTAIPVAHFVFTGWSGDCNGMGACTVVMNAAKGVTANFSLSTSGCLFNWAEDNYPTLFKPSRPTMQTFGDYVLRYYNQTIAYLAISNTNDHLYYYAPTSSTNALLDLGLAATWKTQAGCTQ